LSEDAGQFDIGISTSQSLLHIRLSARQFNSARIRKHLLPEDTRDFPIREWLRAARRLKAILLQTVGQAFIAPNWIVGASYLCAFILMFAFRVGPEEQMMLQQFGDSYEIYMKESRRLVPGIW